jgi:3-oxoacyl-[acyl-carrier protein] reductase
MTDKLPAADLENWLKSVPLGRPGSTQDIANLCVFLGCDMSSYITGQVIHVDGGMHM